MPSDSHFYLLQSFSYSLIRVIEVRNVHMNQYYFFSIVKFNKIVYFLNIQNFKLINLLLYIVFIDSI